MAPHMGPTLLGIDVVMVGTFLAAIATFAVLVALYAVLFVLLSLEEYSLLIGSLLLFAALAGVMYATRGIDWGERSRAAD